MQISSTAQTHSANAATLHRVNASKAPTQSPALTEESIGDAYNLPASAATAALNLPPPKAPKPVVTPRTQAAFASLTQSVDEVLQVMQVRAPAIAWHTLAPEAPQNLSPEEAATHAQNAAQSATKTLQEVVRQYTSLSGHDLFVAFMMLRMQAHSHGLRINEQLADMASCVREAMTQEKLVHDQAAAVLLDRAVKQQADLTTASLWLSGMTAVVSSSIAILMATSGAGLALTVGAIGLGFCAGGAFGGHAKGASFDWRSAFEGASYGAVAVPFGEFLGTVYQSATRIIGPKLPALTGPLPELAASYVASMAPAALQSAGAEVLGVFNVIYERFILNLMTVTGPQTRVGLSMVSPLMRKTSTYYQSMASYRIATTDAQARLRLNLGAMCAQAGKQAQERWKNTTSFLTGMQESHSEAVDQALRMMTMHHQMMQKTANFIR